MNLSTTKLLLWLLSGYILLGSSAVLGQLLANDTDANPHIQANIPCHSCCPGLPGMPGMPGTPGHGIPGQNGEHGIPGQTGEQGSKGDSGNSGEKGIQGEKGEIGMIGAKGEKGDSGKLGPAGPVGQKGSHGPPGVGVPGAIGPKGEQGEAGPIGMPGSPGPVGSAPVQRRSAFTVVGTSGYFQSSTGNLIIKLDTVELNSGSNYNASTGIFTSTIPGVYFFSYHYLTRQNNIGFVQLRKNGSIIASSYDQPNHDSQGGQAVTIQLHMNDKVWIQFDGTSSTRMILSNSYRYASFTGFLLYEI